MLKERLRHYPQLVLLFSKNLKHPQSSKEYFTRFCEEQGFLCEIQEDIENLTVRKGVVYIAIKQQDVVKVVKQGRLEGLKCGKDFGLLAYNDIPSYEVIDEGITSLSIDWEMMGNEAANFVLNNVPIQKIRETLNLARLGYYIPGYENLAAVHFACTEADRCVHGKVGGGIPGADGDTEHAVHRGNLHNLSSG